MFSTLKLLLKNYYIFFRDYVLFTEFVIILLRLLFFSASLVFNSQRDIFAKKPVGPVTCRTHLLSLCF